MRLLLLVSSIFFSANIWAGEYLVKLKNNFEPSALLEQTQIKDSFTLIQGRFLTIDTTEEIYQQLIGDHSIEYIEPNFVFGIDEINRDKKFKKQWGLFNNGWNSRDNLFSWGTKFMDINAKKAWRITKGSHDIKIAVIDTGVDYTHQDLKDNILINELELNGIEGVDDDGNGFVDDVYGYDFAYNDADPMDKQGHGTHCAGVIGASHNKVGIMGVMNKVKILPVQFLNAFGSGTLAAAVRAIDYAIKRDVQIMSNSWGGGSYSVALKEAIEVAESKGILFIAAAGNSNSNNDKKSVMPATLEVNNIIAVGAANGKGKRARFSNYGKKKVHLFAPGVNIYSSIPKNKYKKMSGTSMACPHVAGVAGLIWANEPNLSYEEVKDRLIKNTNEGVGLKDYAQSGLTDAYKALRN